MNEYLALSPPEAAASVRRLVAECRHHQGTAVLLYHNNSLAQAVQQRNYVALVDSLVRSA